MKTLDRGLELMECIIEAQEPVSILALMNLTKLDRSTIYRYIKVLVERRYVKAAPESQGFVPAFRIMELSGAILTHLSIRDEVRPHLLAMSSAFSLTAHLGIRDGDRVLYLDKVESRQSLPLISRIGSRSPLYCTSLGKVFLALEERATTSELISTLSFERRTDNTITTVEALSEELEKIRRQGYAIDNEENEIGVYCMAAPVIGVAGRICAAISVSGLRRQFEDEQAIVTALRGHVAEISQALGGGS
ncbi:MAG: IclR family transcriptional regulator [Lentisphaeria bacterium]|nr:IclR family transcriptional regulator [Lentisphaeria bacterium]